jgi:hypothetical protein
MNQLKFRLVQLRFMSVIGGTRWVALAGYLLAAAGTILYTQIGRVVELGGSGETAMLVALVATFGGFIIAIQASVRWARRVASREPLKFATWVWVGSLLLLLLALPVNHNLPNAILVVPVLLSVINVFYVFMATRR